MIGFESKERRHFLRPKLRPSRRAATRLLKEKLGRLGLKKRSQSSLEIPHKVDSTLEDVICDQLIADGLDPVRFLEELVAIDSTTDNPRGVNLVQKSLADRLERLGFKISWTTNPRGRDTSGELLVATLDPEAGSGPVQYINLVSHADTVLGHEQLGPFHILDDGRTGRGSGVIDNKGGLVVALTGLELFLRAATRRGRRRFGLRFISSPNEEAGSPGFNDLFRAFSEDSVMALGFEPALDDGSIVASRRGNRWYHVTVTGIEAHAGRAKGEHLNAAHEMAIKIAKLHKLNNLKKGLAVNVGRIEGGRDRFNVVCGSVSAKIDARFASFQSRDRLHKKIEKILSTPSVFTADGSQAPQVSVEIADDCPPFASTAQSRRMVRLYTGLIEDIERRPVGAAKAGGAGDVNYMSNPNIVVLDGLGPVGGRMHTIEEFIHLPSLATRSLALSRFLERAEVKL